MKMKISKQGFRYLIVFNYIFLIAMIVLFEFGRLHPDQGIYFWGTGTSLVLLAITFILVYVRTGLWGFVHRKFSQYDEREMLISLVSLRYAYGIFTVVTIAFLFFVSLVEIRLSLLPAAALLYLAHILPASILLWDKKEMAKN